MNYLIVMLFPLLIGGCASINPFSFLTDKPQLEVNSNIGKNVEQEKSTLKIESGNSEQKAETISNDSNQNATTIKNISQNIPFGTQLLIVFLAGIAIPTYSEMYSEVRRIFGDLLVKPIKGIANFILSLFGRPNL